ncbi:MAG: hypothetical protein Q7R41_11010, partial [Phycisphaerales bacterium]|nr:hypothetical protein [Phycisphaerales bacterium]
PDECVNFTALCSPPTDEWSCFDNWDVPGDVYPDNAGESTYSVVLDAPADTVCLDVPVAIDTLEIINGASLRVTQPDPPCAGAARATAADPSTTMDVVSAGGMVVQGSLTVASNNQISVPAGPVIIGPGGVYQLDPAASLSSTAALSAAEVRVVGDDCFVEPCAHGGEMDLSDDMTVTTTGDLVIDGSLANGPCLLASAAAALSFHTPPIIRVKNRSKIGIGGSMLLMGAGALVNDSTLGVTVGGKWDNRSVRPDCFDSFAGLITLDGLTPQTFEVGATDVGPVDAVSAEPFAIGTLQVMSNANVTFVDGFDNDLSGQASCGEAQYVGTLILGANATVTFDHCRVYYGTLIKDPSAQVNVTGCGELREAKNPAAVASDPGGLSKSRMVSFVPPSLSIAGPGSPTALRVQLMSLHNVDPPYTNGSNLPIPFTLFQGQSQYVGEPQSYTESNSDTTTFMASKLQCTPYYQDWSTIPLLHVTGEAILPNSSYDVENLAVSCMNIEDTCTAVSAPLTILTGGSGNVVLSPPATDTWSKVGNFSDISALVAKYQSNPGAAIKARSKIGTTNKRGLISMAPPVGFTDIPVAVDAYRGKPYPYKPGKCSLAPATECKDDTECRRYRHVHPVSVRPEPRPVWSSRKYRAGVALTVHRAPR